MSGESLELHTPEGQEERNSPSLGDDLGSLLGSITDAASRFTARTSGLDQPPATARRLSFAGSPIGDTQQETEQETTPPQPNSNMSGDDDSTHDANASSATPVESILDCSSMFKTTPKDKTKLTGLIASVTRSDRATSAKDKQKIKTRYTTSIPSKFEVPKHYVSSQLGESDDAGSANATSIHDAFIATAQKTRELKNKCTEFDIINTLMIPSLIDNTAGILPDRRWDFTARTHFLDNHAQISMEACKLWVSDCILFDGSGYEAEDQEWLLECARTCCSPDLRQKVDEDFEKLALEFRGGVTYLKLMYDVLVFVNDHVIVGMQKWIKTLANKGLRMFPNESVRELSISTLAICTQLSEASRLPEDAVNDVLTALCNCSHEEFRKQFDTLRTIRDNSILGIGATSGSTLEQIKRILTEADRHYNTYSVNGEWNFSKSVYASACFNCGGDHGLPNCNKPHDKGCIDRAVKEFRTKRGNKQKGKNGNGNGGNKNNNNHQGGKPDNYGRNKWRKPDNPREGGEGRKIDGEIHLACAKCGWNTGDTAHTTKYHASSNKANFSLPDQHPAVLKWGLNDNADKGNGGTSSSKSNDQPSDKPSGSASAGSMNFAGFAAKLDELEKTSDDHDEVKMVSMLSAIFAKLKG